MNPTRNHRQDSHRAPRSSNDSEGGGLGLILFLGLCLLGGIAYLHWWPKSEAPATAVVDGAEPIAEVSGAHPFRSALSGTRPEVVEAPLQKAKPIAQDHYAAPVNHVADSDVCRSLRTSRQRVQDSMSKPHNADQAREYQLDLKSISQRGATEGCWSGGA